MSEPSPETVAPEPQHARAATDAPRRLSAVGIHAALFLGGAAALAYETAWGRMLHRVFGVGDHAVATVLAAFFLGLGLGSAIGGRIAARVARPAHAYAALELAIGVWALLSLVLVPKVHAAYAAVGGGLSLPALTAVRLARALAILLPPTIAMGATLPVVVGAVLRRGAHWSGAATRLYAVNTLGAVLGAGLTGFFLLPRLGAATSIAVAAGASTLAGILAFVSLGTRPAAPLVATAPPSASSPAPRAPARALPVALAFFAGFAALGSEVLWTRVLRSIVQGTTQAFAAMLVCYLGGIALGSLIAPRAARRSGASEASGPLRALGAFQLAACLLTFVGIAAAPQIVRLLVLVHGEPEVVPHEPSVLLFASALLLLPIGIALGTSVPLLFASASPDPREAGAHAGRVLAANTLGGLSGALVAGFVLVPLPRVGGVENALYAIAAVHAILATAALVASAPRRPIARLAAALGPAALVAAALVVRPSLELPFLLDAWFDPADAAIAGPTGLDAPPIFLEEGRSTTVTVVRRDRTLRLMNDGRPESGLTADEPGFGPELVLLGGLPSLFAERTDRALMVGLGGAHSTLMLRAGPFERIDVVELEAAVARAAREMYEVRNAEASRPLDFPLDDRERVHLVIDDARARLAFAAPGTYDAVVSQPSHPWLAGASALFTREFFLEAKRALREGGVLCQWINVFRMDEDGLRDVLATLLGVFPHAVAFMAEDSSLVVLASARPIALGPRVDERLDASPELRRYFGPYGLDDLAELVAAIELDEEGVAAFARGGEVLVDDRPSLEDRLSRIPHQQALEYRDLDRAFEGIPWLGRVTTSALSEELTTLALGLRLGRLDARADGIARVGLTAEALEQPGFASLARGLVAESRGNVGGALAAYDASPDPEAAYRADALRLAEGRFDELAGVASGRATSPADATPLLGAALALGDRALAARGLAAAGPGWADESVRTAADAFARGGCPARVDPAAGPGASIGESAVLDRVARCAREIGRAEEAAAFEARLQVARQGDALREARIGIRAADGGNDGAAIMHLRRALRASPGHRATAQRLVEVLFHGGDVEGAQRALDDARAAARYLPAPVARELADLGRSLGLEVPSPPPAFPAPSP